MAQETRYFDLYIQSPEKVNGQYNADGVAVHIYNTLPENVQSWFSIQDLQNPSVMAHKPEEVKFTPMLFDVRKQSFYVPGTETVNALLQLVQKCNLYCDMREIGFHTWEGAKVPRAFLQPPVNMRPASSSASLAVARNASPHTSASSHHTGETNDPSMPSKSTAVHADWMINLTGTDKLDTSDLSRNALNDSIVSECLQCNFDPYSMLHNPSMRLGFVDAPMTYNVQETTEEKKETDVMSIREAQTKRLQETLAKRRSQSNAEPPKPLDSRKL